jgi:two-component system, NarL family, nitrate/nitrite response regulator NarL
MNKNLFLSPASMSVSRWREAFPDARFHNESASLPALAAGDILWLAAELPNWRGVLMKVLRTSPAAAVVVMSQQPDQDEALAALELGARGYCHALSARALFGEVAEVVRHGGLWVGTELMQRMVAALQGRLQVPEAEGSLSLDGLSEREAEVARLVAAGRSNKEVARELEITERTVKAHLSSIFDKFGVRDRLQLVLRVRRTEQVPQVQ